MMIPHEGLFARLMEAERKLGWDPDRMELASRIFPRRPVYARYLRRKHGPRPGPITEAEKQDAIRILRDPWEDELTVEALRIFDEAGR